MALLRVRQAGTIARRLRRVGLRRLRSVGVSALIFLN